MNMEYNDLFFLVQSNQNEEKGTRLATELAGLKNYTYYLNYVSNICV